jgi:hypothetical protein
MQLGKRAPAEVAFVRACLLGDALGCKLLERPKVPLPPKGTAPPPAPSMAAIGSASR